MVTTLVKRVSGSRLFLWLHASSSSTITPPSGRRHAGSSSSRATTSSARPRTALSAIAAARELRPDFILLDVQLPDLDGFEVCQQLSGDENPPAVVLTSSRDRSDYGPCLATSAASGFLPKAELSAAGIADILAA